MFFFFLAAIAADGSSTAEERALAYLAREVPRWSAKNKCYSCHNNGDAARALYLARKRKMAVPANALEDTSRWLARPTDWAHNGGEGPFNDKVLSRIQFAASLVEALDGGLVEDRQALERAANLVAEDQSKDGHWQIGAEGALGSPATLGNPLATVLARRTLYRADSKSHRERIAAADRWLRSIPVKTVLDAAAVTLGLADAKDDDARAQRERCLALIRKGEAKAGGWGPYVTSPPEPFDTAVVVLALARLPDSPEVRICYGAAELICSPTNNVMAAGRNRRGRQEAKVTRSAFRRRVGRLRLYFRRGRPEQEHATKAAPTVLPRSTA